jgi:conjugative transfer signal peptidase TraF
MTGRAVALGIMTIGIAFVVFTITAKPTPRLLWNASASVPIGLYGMASAGKLALMNLVVATPPQPLASFLAERGYLPLGVPLIKHILAVPGQSVCRNGLLIVIDGIAAGTALTRDSRGRALPAWQGCRVIAPDEVFLMNSDEAASFDGRYFGPTQLSAIVGRALPLWTFAKR